MNNMNVSTAIAEKNILRNLIEEIRLSDMKSPENMKHEWINTLNKFYLLIGQIIKDEDELKKITYTQLGSVELPCKDIGTYIAPALTIKISAVKHISHMVEIKPVNTHSIDGIGQVNMSGAHGFEPYHFVPDTSSEEKINQGHYPDSTASWYSNAPKGIIEPFNEFNFKLALLRIINLSQPNHRAA